MQYEYCTASDQNWLFDPFRLFRIPVFHRCAITQCDVFEEIQADATTINSCLRLLLRCWPWEIKRRSSFDLFRTNKYWIAWEPTSVHNISCHLVISSPHYLPHHKQPNYFMKMVLHGHAFLVNFKGNPLVDSTHKRASNAEFWIAFCC